MAKTDPPARESDLGVDSAASRDVPRIKIECPEDVHLFVDGKEIKPGDSAWAEGPSALHAISLGHAIFVEAETPRGVKRAKKAGSK